VGTRLGYAIAMIFWSLASMGTALGSSLASFAAFRLALGLGEAAVFPASIKAAAEWFPKKERALATGIFNAGTNIGAILTPLVVPWLVSFWGWRGAFIGVGALGFVWLVFWLLIYRRPEECPRVSMEELHYIQSDSPDSTRKIKWSRLFPLRQTWAFAFGKFLIDPVWWFYLFWLLAFLQRKHGLSLQQVFFPIMVVYLISDAGSVAGGWISSSLIKKGKSINAARKTALLICAICVVPVVLVPHMESMWNAVLLIGLAAAAHQGFSANLHADLRHVPLSRDRIRGWYWRNAWRARWALDRIARRPRPSAHRELSDSFFRCWRRILPGVGPDPTSRAPIGTCAACC
jgi:MFS transporter, ACS family, hexuronate transporter